MRTPVQRNPLQSKKDQEREAIVVWDHTGVVVAWPAGHRSRFSWAMLRQACPCAECRRQPAGAGG
jgi:DUF971 family protein